jgi:site-specific DNA recombinase
MNVICYKRVSTEEQRESGFSLQHQERSMRDWCARKNYNIVQVFTEDFSGKNFDRPEWNKLMKYIKQNKNSVDLVLCYRWDRFGRNLSDSLDVIKSLDKLGVNVQASDQETEMNSDDPDAMFMKVFQLLFPEIENRKISKRTLEGMRSGMLEGCWMGGSPIGYDNYRTAKPDEKSSLIPNKDAELVKEAFDKMASGGFSADEIRRWLNEKGLKMVKQSMLNMIRNVAYIGKLKIPKYKGQPEQVVNGLHPPIVTEETFWRANDVLDGRKKNWDFKSDKTDIYPLRGFLKCAIHHTNLTAYPSTGRKGKIYHYYICKQCRTKQGGQRHRVPDVHASIEEILCKIEIGAQAIKLYRRILEKIFDREDVNRKSDIQKVKDEIERNEVRLSKARSMLLDSKIDPDDYNTMKKDLEKSLRELKSKLEQLNSGMTPYKKYLLKEVPMLENLVSFYKSVDGRTKRKILSCIFSDKLVIENGRVATTPYSQGVIIMFNIINALQTSKKEKEVISDLLSTNALPPGLEPGTL